MGEPSVTFSLKYVSRCLQPVHSEKVVSKWVVGTNALREENEVRVLQYDADQERLTCSSVFSHGPEIWDLATSSAPNLLLSVYSQAGTYGASLWRMVPSGSLTRLADLPGHQGIIRGVLWHPVDSSVAVTIEEGLLRKWSISEEGVNPVGQAVAGELLQLWSGALHPLNTQLCATAGGNNVQLWDLRAMSCTGEVQGAHRMPARDVCFCPTNENRLVSAGDDCKLRVWDLRMLGKSEALLELGGHSHWVWRAQYSPFYEQLLASSSSDTLVNLYHTPQLASSSTGSGGQEGTGGEAPSQAGAGIVRMGDLDGKAHTYDEHEDSVYGLAWSAADPWLFASLSYDGRVVVNKVPKNLKYKILL